MKNISPIIGAITLSLAVASNISFAQNRSQGQSMDRGGTMIHDRTMDRDQLKDQDRIKDQDKLKDQDRIRDKDKLQDGSGAGIYGGALMSEEERKQYQENIRSAKTNQERHEIQETHRKEIQDRAHKQGVTLPKE